MLAEIITLRAIALKHSGLADTSNQHEAEIITLRAIALKHFAFVQWVDRYDAEIITLRAIALKRNIRRRNNRCVARQRS